MKKDISYIDRHGHIKSKDEEKSRFRTSRNDNKIKPLAPYINIGYYLLIPLLIGVFGGIYLDSIFRTKPLLTILGIVFGAISSIYNLIKLVQDENSGNKH
ncbi:AtpZ/AtpI family protein [Candidatus Roizmanbacteria bacterium]|nr:AtpZ/AtpI family protein [Candidatus Roizmanbacteria bacterium]